MSIHQPSPANAGHRVVDELLSANKHFAESFGDGEALDARPARRLAVVTCMDARILPDALLGLAQGEAHVLRNAGGRVTDDVLRSLIVSTHLLDVRHIAVIHHTECGMASTDDAAIARQVAETTGSDPGGLEFATIADPGEALRGDVTRVRACPYLPDGTIVSGHVYDVRDGRLNCRVPPAPIERHDAAAVPSRAMRHAKSPRRE